MAAQTRGFLFSDLRGYSAFAERHGDRAARDLLTRYRRVVREAIDALGGAEVRTEGDSFYVVFDSVSQAVQAGLAIQHALGVDKGGPIPAGIGIHAGEVEDDAEHGIVSSAVNIAARICAVAEPREVLVSDTVRALTRTYLDVPFVPRGRRRLKGIRDPVAVYRAGAWSGTFKGSPSRWQTSIHRQGPARLLGVSGIAIVLLFTALLAGTLIRGAVGSAAGDDAPETSAPPQPQASWSASQQPIAAASPSSGEVAQRLNDGEQRLAAIVNEAFQSSCEPAAPESLPALFGPGDAGNNWTPRRTSVYFTAGITCSPFGLGAPEELSLWLLSPPGHDSPAVVSAAEWMANRAAWLEIAAGSCREDRRAIEEWTAGPVTGDLLCFSTDTLGAVIYWTYHEDGVVGRATSQERDLDALLDWWQREARFRDP